MQIISASRRTDVPKFHATWFMGRVREGRVAVRNPYSGQRSEVSLRPEDVRAIVFWSKDYRPLERHLDELDRRGFRSVFQFTITGLPRIFEEHVPDVETSVATARRLAGRTSPAHVLWRFDPIVLSHQVLSAPASQGTSGQVLSAPASQGTFGQVLSAPASQGTSGQVLSAPASQGTSGITGAGETIERFTRLASMLEGATRRCSISFMQFYAKVKRNMAPLEAAHALRFRDPATEEKRTIAARLAAIAAKHGIALVSCCDDALIQAGDGWEVGKGRCVDASLIDALFPDRAASSKPGPTREACGCAFSRDIGAYDTCPHGCFYCYANANQELARRRHAAQDPRASALGEARSEPVSPPARAESDVTRIG